MDLLEFLRSSRRYFTVCAVEVLIPSYYNHRYTDLYIVIKIVLIEVAGCHTKNSQKCT